jgi:hypothetical protein
MDVARGPHGKLKEFKLFQIISNLIRSKHDLPELKKIEIKYGLKGFDLWNNLPY